MTTHAERLQEAGIQLVRLDVEPPERDGGRSLARAEHLSQHRLHVMGILHSRPFRPYRAGWVQDWREYVEAMVGHFRRFVSWWQMENELNHPYHAPEASLNPLLRASILTEGCRTVRANQPEARIVVNVYAYNLPGWRRTYLHDLAALREADVPLDVLGVDLYRGTYAPGAPRQYTQDLLTLAGIWPGDVLLTETGYPAPWLWRSELHQAQYFETLFRTVHDPDFLRRNPWYLGTLAYVYGRDRHSVNPERRFAVLRSDGRPKPAWEVIAQEGRRLLAKKDRILLGVTSHVDERDAIEPA